MSEAARKKADKTAALGTAPMGRLFWKMALPAMLAQAVMMVNNVVDRAWVGHIASDGALSLSAIGLSLPIQHLFLSLILMLGAGMAPVVSILLGKGEREKASQTSGACFGLATLVNVAAFAALTVFADRLLLTFGASAQSLPFARSYLTTIAWGLPFGNTLMLLTMWFNAQGYVADGVKLNLLSVAVNAVLDPVCIFALGMGVAGAALATNLGAIVALAFGLWRAQADTRLLKCAPRDLVPWPSRWIGSVTLGLSTLLNVALESLSMLLFNVQLQRFGGDHAVAALSLLALPVFVTMSLCLGLGVGAQPIISYNYGAKRFDRERQVNRLLTVASFAVSFVFWAAFMAVPATLWRSFTDDAGLVGYTTSYTRLFYAVVLLSGVQYAQLYVIKFIGLVRLSLFLGVLKRLVLLLPMILLLPLVMQGDKVWAVLLAAPLSDGLAFVVTAFCYRKVMKGMKS